MMRVRFVTVVTCVAAALAVVACSSDTTGPGRGTLDLAPLLAETSTGSASSVGGAPVSAVSAGAGGSPAWVPGSCTYSSTAKGFTCPPITANGLTITRSFFLYDAAGNAQSAPDAATTASVRAVTDVSGTLAPPPGANLTGSIALTRHDDVTLSGLLSGTHTLNGTGSGHSDTQLTGAGGQGSQRLVIDETSKTTNLVLPAKGATPAVPQSGTIELNQTLTTTLGSGQPTAATMREVMTFDGTNVVTIEFTVGGTTRTCKLNLANIGASVGCTI